MLDFNKKWRSGSRSGRHPGGKRIESVHGLKLVVSGEMW